VYRRKYPLPPKKTNKKKNKNKIENKNKKERKMQG
jgi:hypothetical protein